MSANGPAFKSTGVVEPQGLRRIWLCLVALGVALIVLGFAAIGAPVVATFATVTVFGILLLFGVGAYGARCPACTDPPWLRRLPPP